jgi:o-succinylbenzoate---CoA ligase
LLRILEINACHERDEVEKKIDLLAHAIAGKINRDETIALYADLSLAGVFLVLSSIKLGLTAALCPLREPDAVLKSWCSQIKSQGVLSSVKGKSKAPGIRPWVSVDELIIKPNRSVDVDCEKKFSSILRTSGTEGQPKSAVISKAAHLASAVSVNNYFSFDKDSVWALNLPLYHTSGLSILFRAHIAHSSIYIAQSHDEVLHGLSNNCITHLSVVPTQLRRLLDSRANFQGVKAIIVGGDALGKPLEERALSSGLPLYETYGLTETASMIFVRDCQKQHRGVVLPHAVLEVSHEDGEILVGGKSLFDGYIGCDGALAPRQDHLFRTSDLSSSSGPIVVGRMSNRIISGGENIQAEEVERALEEHPSIIESIVVGIEDDQFGMRPCAYIKWRGDVVSDEQLYTFLESRLALYKIPKVFLNWPENAPLGLKKPRRWFLTKHAFS